MKKITPAILFIVLGLLVGFGLGQIVKTQLTAREESKLVGSCKSVVNKISLLSIKDIEEYLALPTQKRRYEKANEIMGQLVNIAQQDLGLKVSPEQARLGKEPVLDAPEDHFEKRIIDRFDMDNSPKAQDYSEKK